jgi:hypothetical protein
MRDELGRAKRGKGKKAKRETDENFIASILFALSPFRLFPPKILQPSLHHPERMIPLCHVFF